MSSKGQTGSTQVKHPYFPKSLKLPHYVANNRSSAEILTISALVAILIVVGAWYLTGRRDQQFCFTRRLVLCWFMLCAFIHTFLEGYFAVFHATLAGHSTFLGETWKEYSMGDSRYLSSDTFVVCMETITAVFDGPLAFLTFFAFLKGSNYRYALQMILSLCQLYGDTLYYFTAWKDNFVSSPKNHPLYFYFYVLFINLFWIVIPIALIIDAARHMASCQTVSDFYTDEYNRKVNNHKKVKSK